MSTKCLSFDHLPYDLSQLKIWVQLLLFFPNKGKNYHSTNQVVEIENFLIVWKKNLKICGFFNNFFDEV